MSDKRMFDAALRALGKRPDTRKQPTLTNQELDLLTCLLDIDLDKGMLDAEKGYWTTIGARLARKLKRAGFQRILLLDPKDVR